MLFQLLNCDNSLLIFVLNKQPITEYLCFGLLVRRNKNFKGFILDIL